MDLEKILNQFKTILPRHEYTARSRRELLALTPQRRLTPWNVIREMMQSGIALALTGILIVLVLTGISTQQWFSPIKSLDPKTLSAEAQAIDIQIQLTNLAYTEPSSTAESTIQTTTTSPSAPENAAQKSVPDVQSPLQDEIQKQAESLGIPASSSLPATLSIDEALQKLSQ